MRKSALHMEKCFRQKLVATEFGSSNFEGIEEARRQQDEAERNMKLAQRERRVKERSIFGSFQLTKNLGNNSIAFHRFPSFVNYGTWLLNGDCD